MELMNVVNVPIVVMHRQGASLVVDQCHGDGVALRCAVIEATGQGEGRDERCGE